MRSGTEKSGGEKYPDYPPIIHNVTPCVPRLGGSIESSMGAILPFTAKSATGESPVESAWREYQGLIQRQIDNPELAANYEHCMATARAYRKWCELFLEDDAA